MFVVNHSAHDTPARVRLGRRGEELAAAHLRRRGFDIIARNHRTRYGEIDLIAFDGVTLVFAEVKTRGVRPPARPSARPGAPAASLQSFQSTLGWPATRQRRRLRLLALAWLRDRPRGRPFAREIRFDMVRVLIADGGRLLELEHIAGAC
jgi:putative endonuclease